MAVITQIFITCISRVQLHVLQLSHTSATALSEVHSSGQLMISFLFIHVAFHIRVCFQLPVEEAVDWRVDIMAALHMPSRD
jgi:hypothetical protein